VIELDNRIQPYPWGSRTFLATLQGRPAPTIRPEAELWLGTHPGGPSVVRGTAEAQSTLSDVIAKDPHAILGQRVVTSFGPRLPYLLKVLAADRPLSIQVHPDATQARAGFHREQSAPPAVRNYSDPYPKPELLVALTPFEALCGFRDPDAIADDLDGLGVAALAPVITSLRTGSTAQRLERTLAMLLDWPASARADLVTAVAAAHPLAQRLASDYPTDMGVVVALLLNHCQLGPGEAVYMPAGNVHAYLRGAGVEIMSASDNVLRCGLTGKHVDSAELMRLVRYDVLAEPLYEPLELGPGLTGWHPPAEEFSLVRGLASTGTSVFLPAAGPRIVICVRGEARLRADTESVLPRGSAVFVAADAPGVEVSGDAEVFQAAVGHPSQ
jgi:mannose-6-phosphate isomerase